MIWSHGKYWKIYYFLCSKIGPLIKLKAIELQMPLAIFFMKKYAMNCPLTQGPLTFIPKQATDISCTLCPILPNRLYQKMKQKQLI